MWAVVTRAGSSFVGVDVQSLLFSCLLGVVEEVIACHVPKPNCWAFAIPWLSSFWESTLSCFSVEGLKLLSRRCLPTHVVGTERSQGVLACGDVLVERGLWVTWM